jgi:hypothetical protein
MLLEPGLGRRQGQRREADRCSGAPGDFLPVKPHLLEEGLDPLRLVGIMLHGPPYGQVRVAAAGGAHRHVHNVARAKLVLQVDAAADAPHAALHPTQRRSVSRWGNTRCPIAQGETFMTARLDRRDQVFSFSLLDKLPCSSLGCLSANRAVIGSGTPATSGSASLCFRG